MSEASTLVKQELIFLDVKVDTTQSLLSHIGQQLHYLGYVEQSFTEAIIAREKVFPTGLALDSFNVGIPHTDSIHIKKPFIAVVKTDREIPFFHMGTDDVIIGINFFFVLGIKEPSNQVTILQTLMENLSIKDFTSNLKNARDVDSLYSYLISKF